MKFMLDYPWPGNVREFQNCISYLSIVDHDTIRVEDFPEYILGETSLRKSDDYQEIPVEVAILEELSTVRRKGEKAGRKKLADSLKKRCSDYGGRNQSLFRTAAGERIHRDS